MKSIVDIHSHILPGIDDGSRSLRESLDMLRMEAEQGIECVVATPHFYPRYDTPVQFLEKRALAEAELRAEMKNQEGLPELRVGAEVYFFKGISDSEDISKLAIDGGKYILIEMPASPWTDGMYRELEGLYVKKGLVPIIAHVDRYIGRFRTYGIPKRLAELPVIVQANGGFFLDRSTSSVAIRMLRDNRIHVLGSDCHNMDARKPNLRETMNLIRRRLGDGQIERIHFWEKEILGL